MSRSTYTSRQIKISQKEEELRRLFILQMQDARDYFLAVVKPRLDKAYKLYVSYTGDRAKQIKSWQNNIFVPYTHSVVETMIPRILDARPDFVAQAREEGDQFKTEKQQKLMDYLWEISKMDKTAEDLVRASLIYGTSYLHVYWKKLIKKGKFLQTKDIASKKYEYVEKEKVLYDAPFCEVVDNYSLWYDWHNTKREEKNYWFKRRILTKEEIIKSYPMADLKRIEIACERGSGDLTDYASIRSETKTINDVAYKKNTSTSSSAVEKYNGAEGAEIFGIVPTPPPAAKPGAEDIDGIEPAIPPAANLLVLIRSINCGPYSLTADALITYSPFESMAGIESEVELPGPEI
jgi:hypothetical protein